MVVFYCNHCGADWTESSIYQLVDKFGREQSCSAAARCRLAKAAHLPGCGHLQPVVNSSSPRRGLDWTMLYIYQFADKFSIVRNSSD